jgi:hypothetical protein
MGYLHRFPLITSASTRGLVSQIVLNRTTNSVGSFVANSMFGWTAPSIISVPKLNVTQTLQPVSVLISKVVDTMYFTTPARNRDVSSLSNYYTNPQNATVNDATYATCSAPSSQTNKSLTFELSDLPIIPVDVQGAVITGLEVKIYGNESWASSPSVMTVSLEPIGDTITSGIKPFSFSTNNTFELITLGGSTDTWGLSSTNAKLSYFVGGMLSLSTGSSSDSTVSIDYVTIKVWYNTTIDSTVAESSVSGSAITTSATNYTGSGSVTTDWTNITNVQTYDGTSATASLTNFGDNTYAIEKLISDFSIPSNATITHAVIIGGVASSGASGIVYCVGQPTTGGTVSPSSFSTGGQTTSNNTPGVAFLYLNWAPGTWDSNAKLAMQITTFGSATFYFDYVRIHVFYTAPPTISVNTKSFTQTLLPQTPRSVIQTNLSAFSQILNSAQGTSTIFPGVVSYIQSLLSPNVISTSTGVTVLADLLTFTQSLNDPTQRSVIINTILSFIQTELSANSNSIILPTLTSFTQTLNTQTVQSLIGLSVKTFTQVMNSTTVNYNEQVAIGLLTLTQQLYSANSNEQIAAALLSFVQTLNTVYVKQQEFIPIVLKNFVQTFLNSNVISNVSPGLTTFTQTTPSDTVISKINPNVESFVQSFAQPNSNFALKPGVTTFIQSVLDCTPTSVIKPNVETFIQSLIAPNTNFALKPGVTAFIQSMFNNQINEGVLSTLLSFAMTQNDTKANLIVKPNVISQIQTLLGVNLGTADYVAASLLMFTQSSISPLVNFTLKPSVLNLIQSLNATTINKQTLINSSYIGFTQNGLGGNTVSVINPALVTYLQQLYPAQVLSQKIISINTLGLSQSGFNPLVNQSVTVVPLSLFQSLFTSKTNATITPSVIQFIQTFLSLKLNEFVDISKLSFNQVGNNVNLNVSLLTNALQFTQTLKDGSFVSTIKPEVLMMLQVLESIYFKTSLHLLKITVNWSEFTIQTNGTSVLTPRSESLNKVIIEQGNSVVTTKQQTTAQIETVKRITGIVDAPVSTTITAQNYWE